MNVIFMGTPDFSVPVLEGLINSKHNVTAVFTQPDKPRGRSGKLVFSPVKQVAVDNNIDVYTPNRIKDEEYVKLLKEIPCDVMVVVAFGQILTKEILDIPKYGCINVHASLLPRWRGAAPIQWSILEGDDVTGITTMQMNEGIDTGDILLKKEIVLTGEETGESLFDQLAMDGPDLLLETLELAEQGKLNPVKQDESKACYAKMLSKELGNIDWESSAVHIERYVRGLNSWPSAYSSINGKTLKIWKSKVYDEDLKGEPGAVVKILKNSFVVATGDGCLEILEVQLEGKKRMDSGSFLRGVSLQEGERLCKKM